MIDISEECDGFNTNQRFADQDFDDNKENSVF